MNSVTRLHPSLAPIPACGVDPEILDGEGRLRRRVRRPVRVVVVGGGSAGMQAACAAAEAGCEVVVMEKRRRSGGAACPAGELGRRARAAGVELRFGVEADVDKVAAERPDLVVNAAGANPALAAIPGLLERIDAEGSGVYSIIGMSRAIDGPGCSLALAGKPVVVVGGGAVEPDVIAFVCGLGAHVTLVERLPASAGDLERAAALRMHEALRRDGVRVLAPASLKEVRDGGVVIEADAGGSRLLPSAATFVCLGLRADNALCWSLEDRFGGTATRLYSIGDSVRRCGTAGAPGDILAVLEDMGAF